MGRRTRRRTRNRTRGHRARRRTPRGGVGAPRRSARLANKRFKKNMSMKNVANILEEIVDIAELPIQAAVGVTKGVTRSAVGATRGVGKAAKKTAKRMTPTVIKKTSRKSKKE